MTINSRPMPNLSESFLHLSVILLVYEMTNVLQCLFKGVTSAIK